MKEEELKSRKLHEGNGRKSKPIELDYQKILSEWLAIREERDFLRQRVADLEMLLLDEVFSGGSP